MLANARKRGKCACAAVKSGRIQLVAYLALDSSWPGAEPAESHIKQSLDLLV